MILLVNCKTSEFFLKKGLYLNSGLTYAQDHQTKNTYVAFRTNEHSVKSLNKMFIQFFNVTEDVIFSIVDQPVNIVWAKVHIIMSFSKLTLEASCNKFRGIFPVDHCLIF